MRHKKATKCRLQLVLTAVAALLAVLPAAGAELTVMEYVELTISRLELAQTTWSEEGRSPTETEEAALFDELATDAETYYRFAGQHRQKIEDYLAANPELQQQIDSLSDAVGQLIEQSEVD